MFIEVVGVGELEQILGVSDVLATYAIYVRTLKIL